MTVLKPTPLPPMVIETRVVDELSAPSQRRYVSPYNMARVHAAAGDAEQAFIALETAFDERNPENSWQLKRNFDLVFRCIDEFLDRESVSERDQVTFTFRNQPHAAISKVLMITKNR